MALQTIGSKRIYKPFAEKEGEDLVNRLRQHLSDVETAVLLDHSSGAYASAKEAGAIYSEIEQRLLTRFERYARAYFPGESNLQEDAVVEMLCGLYETLMGDPERNAYFGKRFNDAIKCLIVDAIRAVRTENGRNGKTGKPHLDVESASRRYDKDSGEQPQSLEDRAGASADNVVETVIGRDLEQRLLSRLPSDTHRTVFLFRASGEKWQDIAAMVGLSKRTVENYFEQSRGIMKDILADMQGARGL